MILFCLNMMFWGIAECFISTLNVIFIQKRNVLWAFISAFINAMIWLYLVNITPEMYKSVAKYFYSAGLGLGVIIAILFDRKLEKIAKIKGFKYKKLFKKWLLELQIIK